MDLSNSSDTIYTKRVSLYLKVANVLRSRILSGIWRSGDRLPNIMALCSEFNVGRITVRQALQLLTDEGLIDSRRGRGTYVLSDTKQSKSRRPILDQLDGQNQEIRVLDISDPLPIPNALRAGFQTHTYYRRIRKLRSHQGTAYCLMDIYVENRLFEVLPLDELTSRTVAKLIHEYAHGSIKHAKQTVGITLADYETSRQLKCDMSAPLAEVDRYFIDREEKLLSYGHYLYRGDMFLMETTYDGDPVSDASSGWLPDVKEE